MANNDLLKAGMRFLPKVADALFKVGSKIAFVAKANTAASVAITMEKNEVRGGQNNALLGAVFSDTNVEVSFTSVEWKPEFLASNIGSQIKIGKFDFMSLGRQITTIEDAGKIIITLEDIPVNNVIYIENDGTYIEVPATTTSVDVTSLGCEVGECLNVLGIFKRNGLRIPIGTDQTPLVGELTLSSPIFEGTKGKVGEAQYVFGAFQFDGSFTQNFTSDSSYEMKGTAVSVPNSGECGEGDLYGSYQEYLYDQTVITNYSTILAVPSLIEISGTGSQPISVYGIKNVLYDRALIATGADLVFSIPSSDSGIATVDQDGKVTGVAPGNTTVTVTYNKKLTAEVDVTIS